MIIRIDDFEETKKRAVPFTSLKIGEVFVEKDLDGTPDYDEIYIKIGMSRLMKLDNSGSQTEITNSGYTVFPVDLEVRIKK